MELIWTFPLRIFQSIFLKKFYMARMVKKFISAMTMILARSVKAILTFEGVIHNVERRFRETSSDYIREQMEKYMGTSAMSGLQRETA